MMFDPDAYMPRIIRGMVYLGACLIAEIRLTRSFIALPLQSARRARAWVSFRAVCTVPGNARAAHRRAMSRHLATSPLVRNRAIH